MQACSIFLYLCLQNIIDQLTTTTFLLPTEQKPALLLQLWIDILFDGYLIISLLENSDFSEF